MNTAPSPTPEQTVQILVLDDSREELHLMRCVMEDLRVAYPVRYFERAFSLIACLDRQAHASGSAFLIFTDWRLNQARSQANNLAQIRQHHVGQLCPIAVMSNHLTEADRARCRDLGANYIFDKPADYEQLLHTVQGILRAEYLL